MTVAAHDEPIGQMIAVGQAGGDRGRSGHALVAVMKPVDFEHRRDKGPVDGTAVLSTLSRPVRASAPGTARTIGLSRDFCRATERWTPAREPPDDTSEQASAK
jgi:hypothetical protein